MHKILFILNYGRNLGLGHLSRCSIIAKCYKENGISTQEDLLGILSNNFYVFWGDWKEKTSQGGPLLIRGNRNFHLGDIGIPQKRNPQESLGIPLESLSNPQESLGIPGEPLGIRHEFKACPPWRGTFSGGDLEHFVGPRQSPKRLRIHLPIPRDS